MPAAWAPRAVLCASLLAPALRAVRLPERSVPVENGSDADAVEEDSFSKSEAWEASGCACLPWHLAHRRVGCNPGKELPLGEGLNLLREEICDGFYMKMPTAQCTNVGFSFDTAQWCYVSARCDSVDGSQQLGGEVSWKTCEPGTDDVLAERSIEELTSIAKAADLDIGLLVKMAYPTLQGLPWSGVQDFLLGEGNPEHLSRLQQIVGSGKPVVFDVSNTTSDDSHRAFGVLVGARAYKLIYEKGSSLVGGSGQGAAHPQLKCVHGC